MKITLELTTQQAALLEDAVNAEINKGKGTFLSDNDIKELSQIRHTLNVQLLQAHGGCMKKEYVVVYGDESEERIHAESLQDVYGILRQAEKPRAPVRIFQVVTRQELVWSKEG